MIKVDSLWLRLNALVPEPQCTTFDDDFDRIEWNDIRPQPTLAELSAVDLAPILSAIKDKENAQSLAAGEFKLLVELAGKTDDQITEWIKTNVTDLASAKKAISILARAVGALARHLGL